MSTKVTMPKLGLTMVEGKITEWKKKEGDSVEKGKILFIIETEKVSYEIESPESGVLAKVVAKEGDTIPVGGVVAYIAQPGEKLDEALNAGTPKAKGLIGKDLSEEEIPAPAQIPEVDLSKGKRIKASPLAKKIAGENKVDLSIVAGTGPNDRIVKKDVLKAIDEKRSVRVSGFIKEEIIPLTSMRETIARRMSQSFQTAPHFWIQNEVDATGMIKARDILLPVIEKETGIKVSYTDILLKLVSKAMQESPYVNATWTEQGIKLFKEINIGVAVDIPNGLIVPIIKRVEDKTLAEIVAERVDLVNRAKENKLVLEEMTGGTFTFNNVGGLGITAVNSIINPPESCILGIGAIADKPVVLHGEIVVRPMFFLNLACDHRILDGGNAARFLKRVKALIEKPILMLS